MRFQNTKLSCWLLQMVSTLHFDTLNDASWRNQDDNSCSTLARLPNSTHFFENRWKMGNLASVSHRTESFLFLAF